jgi:hypothetical protein
VKIVPQPCIPLTARVSVTHHISGADPKRSGWANVFARRDDGYPRFLGDFDPDPGWADDPSKIERRWPTVAHLV